MKNAILWNFPEIIQFEEVPTYVDRFKRMNTLEDVIFDLSRTKSMHSSFIGFLIHVQDIINRRNQTLHLNFSLDVLRTLAKMNIANFFSSFSIASIEKKSA